MKAKLKIQFHHGSWFLPNVNRRRVKQTSPHRLKKRTSVPGAKPKPEVLVILPDGKVVRQPKPTLHSAAIGAIQ